MAEIYKLIHPNKYFYEYIDRNVRPDGRKFEDHREIKLNINAIKTADSSAIAKCGNTTVICGIKLELARPKAEEPELGYVVTNVELPPLCSSKFRPGPPSDHAQFISNIVSDIFKTSKCVDLKDLCIVPDKLAWVVYCDMVCLNNDGSVVDSCIMTLVTSLKLLCLPSVTYDAETEEIKVDDNIKTPLKVQGAPVSTSFIVCQQLPSTVVLIDPSAYEEEMCGGSANLIICWNEDKLCGVHKFGGSNLTNENEKKTIIDAKERSKLVTKVIETCTK